MFEVAAGRPWSFDGDGALFRLVSEAQRIRLAHLFDPVLAVHTSVVEPLPHQITAVYEAMLPRQPLRFLLADDPGAGKTIMAGLLIKELVARGDLERCLIVCPGSLAEQWQDELYRRFQLPFEILTNDKLEAARTRNWFLETNLVIAWLDKLSRDEDVQQKLQAPDAGWDLVVCDEAHKLSATFFSSEIKYTKRYRLGQLLSGLTRHLLLMTATPHNGKEQDFQLFLALLDGDRFEGRFRDGVHAADVSDLMRRMVKERLLKFDGKPLFPERIAHTVPYRLSEAEARLYTAVTDYVREEFDRAEALVNAKRAGTVGFALTLLQRRLASSPEAIYQSLRRRRERLESRLRELEVLQRGGQPAPPLAFTAPELDADDVEDLDDAPEQEVEDAEARILDQATAARSIVELKAELETLKALETLALGVRRSGADTKWRELADLFGEIFTAAGRTDGDRETATSSGDGETRRPASSPRQKLVLFTEHRDTLRYLQERITTLLGRETAVVVIHGSIGREERLAVQESFRHDPQVQVLLATDAAGEGINLQRAHLMVNYDLPWNPNRLEQRFGRIHRIGQTEVCHLWNLVADETREGDVYRRLLDKLDARRPGLRRAREAGVRRTAAARAAARRHSLRRAAGGPRPARHRRRPGARPRRAAGPARGVAARPRRDGRHPRAARARGDGTGRGAPPAAALGQASRGRQRLPALPGGAGRGAANTAARRSVGARCPSSDTLGSSSSCGSGNSTILDACVQLRQHLVQPRPSPPVDCPAVNRCGTATNRAVKTPRVSRPIGRRAAQPAAHARHRGVARGPAPAGSRRRPAQRRHGAADQFPAAELEVEPAATRPGRSPTLGDGGAVPPARRLPRRRHLAGAVRSGVAGVAASLAATSAATVPRLRSEGTDQIPPKSHGSAWAHLTRTGPTALFDRIRPVSQASEKRRRLDELMNVLQRLSSRWSSTSFRLRSRSFPDVEDHHPDDLQVDTHVVDAGVHVVDAPGWCITHPDPRTPS